MNFHSNPRKVVSNFHSNFAHTSKMVGTIPQKWTVLNDGLIRDTYKQNKINVAAKIEKYFLGT